MESLINCIPLHDTFKFYVYKSLSLEFIHPLVASGARCVPVSVPSVNMFPEIVSFATSIRSSVAWCRDRAPSELTLPRLSRRFFNFLPLPVQ